MNARRLPRAGGFGRAAPALLALAVLALAVEGCASLGLGSGCSTCGGAGPVATVRRFGQRVFHRNAGCADCGGGIIGGGAVIEPVAPPIITTPPAVVPEAVGPAVGAPPPSADEAPLDLRPLPAGEGPEPTTDLRGNRRGAGLQMAGRDNVSRAGGRGAAGPASPDPLARFEARLEAPAAPDVGAEAGPSPPPQGTPPASQVAPEIQPSEEAPDASSLHSGAEDLEVPPRPLDVPAALAPGFSRFENVEPKLSGGALPSESGWSWLVEQGYRTVLDLRPMGQIRQEEVARINSSGLRHLALPVTDENVADPSTLALFAALVGPEASRPLFFFDADGSHAAVLWYLHRVVDLRDAPEDAVRQADAIGPRVPALWDRATALVDRSRPAPAASTVPAPEPPEFPAPDREPEAAPARKAAANLEAKAEAVLDRAAALVRSHVNPPAPPAAPPQAPPPIPPDPTAWRPYATLAATGLTVPLFFLGRSAISHVARPKASPTGAEHARRSLPDASGA
jgi:hypothetical protein